MFEDRRAKFRSYWQIEAIAEKARACGRVTAHSQFDIVGFITGFIQLRMKGDFCVKLYDPKEHPVPAYVTFENPDAISLNVSSAIWCQAKAGFAFAKFVLAHEVGHILLHQHDALAYSALTPSKISSIEAEERTEPQADLFADLFLVPTAMLAGFSCPEDISDYFNVPIECAVRRFEYMTDLHRRRAKPYVGEACLECANFTLVRNGTCLKCDTCGSTTGCS